MRAQFGLDRFGLVVLKLVRPQAARRRPLPWARARPLRARRVQLAADHMAANEEGATSEESEAASDGRASEAMAT